MTQLMQATQGIITEEMRHVAEAEGVEPESIRSAVAEGTVVIPKNINHSFKPRGIGKGLRTKVNANIGTSEDHKDLAEELEKLKAALEAGSDSVMDLSTGGELSLIRKEIIARSDVMVGSVPIYQAATQQARRNLSLFELAPDQLFDVIEEHAASGIDYITVHCGVTRRSLERLAEGKRLLGIVSRGGSILAAWMRHNKKENPLYEQFDRLLKIAARYDVTLSLGDGLRPGSVVDASDKCQFEELMTLGELAQRARAQGVQAMIEGPGHVPLDQVALNVNLQKKVCQGAPFYVLGPLTTDIAPGYDHITAAIGGAIAAAAGADFLCYVTPAEHLRLPTVEDVRLGVIAARIAAHSGDIAKGVKGAMERDAEMSKMRRALDWEGMYRCAVDPSMARQMRMQSEDYDKEVCTMCGYLCSIRMDSKSGLPPCY